MWILKLFKGYIICLLVLNLAQGKASSFLSAKGSKDARNTISRKSYSNLESRNNAIRDYQKITIPKLDFIIGNNNVETFLKNPVTLHELVLQSLLKNGDVREVNVTPLTSSEKIVQNHLDSKHEELHALIKEVNIRKDLLDNNDSKEDRDSLDTSSEQEASTIEKNSEESDQSQDSEYASDNSNTDEDNDTLSISKTPPKSNNAKQSNPSQRHTDEGGRIFNSYNLNVKLSEALNNKMKDLYQLEYQNGKSNRLKRALKIPKEQSRNRRSIYENLNQMQGLHPRSHKVKQPVDVFLRNDDKVLSKRRSPYGTGNSLINKLAEIKPNIMESKINKRNNNQHRARINNYLGTRQRKRNLRKNQFMYSYPLIRSKKRENKIKKKLFTKSKQRGPLHSRLIRDTSHGRLKSSNSKENDSNEDGEASTEEVSSKSSRSVTFDWYEFSKHLKLFEGTDFSIIKVLKRYYKKMQDNLHGDDHKREIKHTENTESLQEEEPILLTPKKNTLLQETKKEQSAYLQQPTLVKEPVDNETTLVEQQSEKETKEDSNSTSFTIKRKNKILLPLRLVRDDDGNFTVQLDMKYICTKFIRDKAKRKREKQIIITKVDDEQ